MNKVLAIAAIAIRNAIRSRIVIMLLAALLLSIVGIPLTVKGDGTMAGYVQVLLRYTIGFASIILSLATIWAGCAAVSLEIQDRTLQLVVTKPVHRWQVWLGKWLGLVAMNAVLLAFCAAVSYGLLRWTTRPERLDEQQVTVLHDEILTARQEIIPARIDVEDEALARLAEIKASGELPPEAPESEVLEAVRRGLLRQYYSVPPGAIREWVFEYPAALEGNEPVLFRYRVSASQMNFEKIKGTWRVGREDNPKRYDIAKESVPSTPDSFLVPAEALAGGGNIIVEYVNDNDRPITAVFNPDDGLRMLVYAGSFAANFTRAFLVLFFQLMFLSAIGVTMGSLFSMPVASFAAFCLLLFTQASGYIKTVAEEAIVFHTHTHGGPPPEPGFWDAFFRAIFKVLNVVVAPLRGPNPLDLLADGRLIMWAWVGNVFVIKVILYSGLLALFSAWVLNRREVALPGT